MKICFLRFFFQRKEGKSNVHNTSIAGNSILLALLLLNVEIYYSTISKDL
jgi:hypothetical protein